MAATVPMARQAAAAATVDSVAGEEECVAEAAQMEEAGSEATREGASLVVVVPKVVGMGAAMAALAERVVAARQGEAAAAASRAAVVAMAVRWVAEVLAAERKVAVLVLEREGEGIAGSRAGSLAAAAMGSVGTEREAVETREGQEAGPAAAAKALVASVGAPTGSVVEACMAVVLVEVPVAAMVTEELTEGSEVMVGRVVCSEAEELAVALVGEGATAVATAVMAARLAASAVAMTAVGARVTVAAGPFQVATQAVGSEAGVAMAGTPYSPSVFQGQVPAATQTVSQEQSAQSHLAP